MEASCSSLDAGLKVVVLCPLGRTHTSLFMPGVPSATLLLLVPEAASLFLVASRAARRLRSAASYYKQHKLVLLFKTMFIILRSNTKFNYLFPIFVKKW